MDREILRRTLLILLGIYCFMHLSASAIGTILAWAVGGAIIYTILKCIKEFEI